MLETINHIVGVCPDAHVHFDLIEFLSMGMNETAFHARYLAYQIQNFLKLWV